MFDFEIKLAQSKEEKEGAFRLREEVFNRELSGLHASGAELEKDIYDNICDHLIVLDKTKNMVVGTYRLLSAGRVDPAIGFYSEKIFDISRIKCLGSAAVELGRSCVHKDYREGAVINLLWEGIAQYIRENGARFLFGSVRLYTTDLKEVSEVFSLVKDDYYSSEEFRVLPHKENAFNGVRKRRIAPQDRKTVFRKLPPLIKGYLRLGLKICGPPAWNRDLGSVVFFVLLDTQNMSAAYKRHFLGA